MAGNQSSASEPARYRFILKDIDYRKRDGWHHAFFNGPRDQRMKRALHRGNERNLNLYINGGDPGRAGARLVAVSVAVQQHAQTRPRLGELRRPARRQGAELQPR